MTPSQINALIAEKCMNWQIHRSQHSQSLDVIMNGNESIMWLKDWNPHAKIAQAMEASEKLTNGVGSCGDSWGWSWAFEMQYIYDDDYTSKDGVFHRRKGWVANILDHESGFCDTPAEAICLALYSAIKDQLTKESE